MRPKPLLLEKFVIKFWHINNMYRYAIMYRSVSEIVGHFLVFYGKQISSVLRASCLTLEINEFRCYEAKIEESEKAGSRRESNPGHLWLEPPVLCH